MLKSLHCHKKYGRLLQVSDSETKSFMLSKLIATEFAPYVCSAGGLVSRNSTVRTSGDDGPTQPSVLTRPRAIWLDEFAGRQLGPMVTLPDNAGHQCNINIDLFRKMSQH